MSEENPHTFESDLEYMQSVYHIGEHWIQPLKEKHEAEKTAAVREYLIKAKGNLDSGSSAAWNIDRLLASLPTPSSEAE